MKPIDRSFEIFNTNRTKNGEVTQLYRDDNQQMIRIKDNGTQEKNQT